MSTGKLSALEAQSGAGHCRGDSNSLRGPRISDYGAAAFQLEACRREARTMEVDCWSRPTNQDLITTGYGGCLSDRVSVRAGLFGYAMLPRFKAAKGVGALIAGWAD